MAVFTTKKPGFIGEFFQAIYGEAGMISTGKALEFHILKPEGAEYINFEMVIRKFKTTGFHSPDGINKSWIELEKLFNTARTLCLFPAARAFYFPAGNNIGKHFRLNAEVFQAVSAYKYGFFGKHTINLKKVLEPRIHADARG